MKISQRIGAFWHDESGGQVLEWPMVTAILVLLIIAGWTAMGSGFSDLAAAIGSKHAAAAAQVQAVSLPE